MNNKTICIDFDGVIHKYSKGWFDGSIYDEPMEGAKEKLHLLRQDGYKVIVFTVRENKEDIIKWLDKYLIQVDGISNIKVPALAYIDDRGIRFTNWEDIVKYFI